MYETKTYESILADALSRVPSGFDTREGSIIYDAIAPACAELARLYIDLDSAMNESFGDTATGEFLDRRCAERGIIRNEGETDEHLRERYFNSLNEQGFSGNKAWWRNNLLNTQWVGAVKIKPNASTPSKLSIYPLGKTYMPLTQEEQTALQDWIDPEINTGGTGGNGVGIAPIGCQATVKPLTAQPILVSAHLTFASGYDWSSVQQEVTNAVKDYVNSFNVHWGESSSNIIIRLSAIESTILNVGNGRIVDVTTTKINNVASNYEITSANKYPNFGSFTNT